MTNLSKIGEALASELPWRDRVEVFATTPDHRIYGGVWDSDKSFAVPGGGVDPGEDPATAAMREYLEETGLKIQNAKKLDIPTIDHPWSDDYRKAKGRNFAGSRTHFIHAAIDPEQQPVTEGLDPWNAGQRGWYDPEKAIEIMADKQYLAPVVAAARLKVLRMLLEQKRKAALK